MKINFNKINTQQITSKSEERANSHNATSPTFTGPLDGLITQSLITIDTNPMVNAALVDVFAMVIPRTYVDTKKRNKYAGAETFFRELTGTIIVCLSSGVIAKGISHLYNKFVSPKTKVNPNSWVTNDGLNLLKHSWDRSENNTEKYVSNIFSNLSGTDGRENSTWKGINWENTQWLDDEHWNYIKWENQKFNNIQKRLRNKDNIIHTFSEIIENKSIAKNDAKNIIKIIEHRINNALKVSNSISVNFEGKSLNSSLTNLLRDTYDLGKNVFTDKHVNIEAAINKLTKINKVKTLGALAAASTLGLTNQYINRKITKKRTGSDAFVGEVDYNKMVNKKSKINNAKQTKEKNLVFWKLLASAGILGLSAFVMKIKNPSDFIKKLEFTGPITSGNAIKTVYTATLVGRFLAAKNKTELRESTTRDYLGFLNWLVLGGFAAKGVANLLDKGQNNLFNIHKTGKGLKHWLNDISLKSHAEVAAKGEIFAQKNIWKLNLAHASGLAYSTIALGLLLPLLNIAITKHEHKKHIRDVKSV